MVTIEDVLKEYHPLGTCQQAPSKPPKMAKFNVYYWHRRYPTHKPLKANARIDEKLKNGDFEYSPYGKYLDYEYWWMAEEIVKIRNSDKSDGYKKDAELEVAAKKHEENLVQLRKTGGKGITIETERYLKERQDINSKYAEEEYKLFFNHIKGAAEIF